MRNESLKKLIRPGMALRRLNAELIYEVLNETCQLALTSKEEAETLFQELRKELYLVEEGREPSELRFRTSIRQELYRYLKADPEIRKQLETIHRKAIEFYRNKDSVAERAEEIYHRLAFEQSRKAIDKRWEEGVENYLISALGDSLPLPSLAYLANKLGLEAPVLLETEYWQQAQTLVWEVRAERNAARQLKLDKPEEALRIISERKNWTPNSPLYLIKAKALRRQNKLTDALEVIRRAIDVCQDQRSKSALNLWFLLFWLEMEQGRQQEADRALSVIQDWIGEGRDVEERLEVAVRQLVSLRVNGRNIGNVYQDWAGKAAKAIEDALTSPSKSERPYAQKNPKLIRRLVAEIADYRIDLLRKALDELGIGEHIPSKARVLATSLTQWQGREPNIQLPSEAGLIVPQYNQPDIIEMWLHWLLYESGIKVGQGLAAILGDKFSPPLEVIRDVADLLRFSDEAPREPEVQERRNLIHESEKRRMGNVQRLRQSFSSPDKLDAFLRSQFGIELAQLTTPPLKEEQLALDVAKWAETHGLSETMQKMLKE